MTSSNTGSNKSSSCALAKGGAAVAFVGFFLMFTNVIMTNIPVLDNLGWLTMAVGTILAVLNSGECTKNDPKEPQLKSPDEEIESAVTEAEIFKAYGRDKQAISAITTALEKYPNDERLLNMQAELQSNN